MFQIRQATPEDAAELVEIYRPFVEQTAVSFETVTPTPKEFAARIESALEGWQWLVAESEGRCIGYAYASSHRARAAYRYSVETSAYIDGRYHRMGLGRALYLELLDDVIQKGYCNAFAGITLPNDASVALHRGLGFEPIGVFKAVGRKFGRWHDVAWLGRALRETPLDESAPSTVGSSW